MPTIVNVKVEDSDGTQIAYGAQADWDQAQGTITLWDGINDNGLTQGGNYTIDSKDLTDTVAVSYAGPDHNNNNNPIFVILP
jgi:hypothetical protein